MKQLVIVHISRVGDDYISSHDADSQKEALRILPNYASYSGDGNGCYPFYVEESISASMDNMEYFLDCETVISKEYLPY